MTRFVFDTFLPREVAVVDLVPALQQAFDDIMDADSVSGLAATPIRDAEWELLPFVFICPE